MKIIRNGVVFVFALIIVMSCTSKKEPVESKDKYACPMHPKVVQDKPGVCPICKMDLVKLTPQPVEKQSLMLDDQQILLGNIKTVTLRTGSYGNGVSLNGRLTETETGRAVVSSRVGGRIEGLFVRLEGTTIVKGEPLYSIYSETLQSLEREYRVALEQHSGNEKTDGFLTAAKRKLELLGMTESQLRQLASGGVIQPAVIYYSPVSGTLISVNVTEGQYVDAGAALYTIVPLDPLRIEAELYSGETAMVKPGDEVSVRINGFENEPITTHVNFVNPEYRNGTQVLVVRAQVPNANRRFQPGMQATMVVPRISAPLILVPSSSVIHDTHGDHVWVQQDDGAFSIRPIAAGIADERITEIKSGLRVGDHVVVSGAGLLDSEWVFKQGNKTDGAMAHIH